MADTIAWLPLSANASDAEREQRYRDVRERLEQVLADERDWVAAMATVVCELHHAFDYFDWTGFYRVVPGSRELVIGPYQGTHGCLRIGIQQGVCGLAARTRETQRVDDVSEVPDHIACSATTRSELVVPVLSSWGKLLGVLDIDSDTRAVFSAVDQLHAEKLCQWLGSEYEADALS